MQIINHHLPGSQLFVELVQIAQIFIHLKQNNLPFSCLVRKQIFPQVIKETRQLSLYIIGPFSTQGPSLSPLAHAEKPH